MSVKGIIMFLRMNNTRLERKILIILDFENGFLPTYLPLCPGGVLTATDLKQQPVGPAGSGYPQTLASK